MPCFYKNGLLLLLLAVLVSCKNDGDGYTAYFGGIVTNPSSRYVILNKDNYPVDTIPLDKKNRFFVKFDSLTPGLYSFRHNTDHHNIYFDKNDSLVVSIDGLDFDNSVIFSGRGDRKNNFMMELYLINEKEHKSPQSLYDLNAEDFNRKIDSIFGNKVAKYKKNKRHIKWSKGFDFYAKARLNLNYYTKKEQYPYAHAIRTGENIRNTLPKDYYAFRREIDFNDKRLTHFSPFARYLTAMLSNMASAKHHKISGNKSLIENTEKLRIADSIFVDKSIKNEILDNIAFAYILEDENIASNEKFLDEYIRLSTPSSKDNDIKKMGYAIKKLKSGNKIPPIKLVDAANKAFVVQRDIKKQTVIFFWTACARQNLDMMIHKVKSLRKEHPDVSFIAVNVDEEPEWKRLIDHYTLRDAISLHATDFEELKFKWVFTKINRTIILNADGTIKNAFTNLMDPDFAEQLN